MNTFTTSLRSWAFHDVVEDRRAWYAFGVIAFVVAAAASAQVAVRLPLTPVPVTMQPLMVILAGAVLGPRLGALSMAAYVTVGALGAPVFSNGGAGLPWLLGPTGGYLLAAPAAAFVTGMVAGRETRWWRLVAGLALGVATMYVGGVLQLMALTGQDLAAALAMGVIPFLVGDLTKLVVAVGVVRAVKWSGRRRS